VVTFFHYRIERTCLESALPAVDPDRSQRWDDKDRAEEEREEGERRKVLESSDRRLTFGTGGGGGGA